MEYVIMLVVGYISYLVILMAIESDKRRKK
mgnify:CR=1 FL=1|jgi:hypothetical protein